MDLKGSRTEVNLMKAFAGESQARNRYNFFADKAKKEGYERIAAIFELTAEQERVHAKKFFSFLTGGMTEITAAFPAGVVGSTLENLEAAAAGEHEEHTALYPEFADVAREEGFANVAKVFDAIRVAEKYHEKRYRLLADDLRQGALFKKEENTSWYCRKCGYIHEGPEAPDFCPACNHPKAYFEVSEY